jgi:hypothetical protein
MGPAGPAAVVPKSLALDNLKIGRWNINPVGGGNVLKFQLDGTNNPVSITNSGRLMTAWPVDYNEGNWNDRDFRTARGEDLETWRAGW